jgi:hypothetical protein
VPEAEGAGAGGISGGGVLGAGEPGGLAGKPGEPFGTPQGRCYCSVLSKYGKPDLTQTFWNPRAVTFLSRKGNAFR